MSKRDRRGIRPDCASDERAERAGKWTRIGQSWDVFARRLEIRVRGEAILSHCSLRALVPRLLLHDSDRSWALFYDHPRTCDDLSRLRFLLHLSCSHLWSQAQPSAHTYSTLYDNFFVLPVLVSLYAP